MPIQIFSEFTNQYSLSKTLRFELKPVGKTLEHIESKGLLSDDEGKAEDYKKAKKLIDEYHKVFIENILNEVVIEGELLAKIYECYKSLKRDKNNNELKTVYSDYQKKLRTSIYKLINEKGLSILFEKEFIDGGKQEITDENGKKKKIEMNSQVIDWLESLKLEREIPDWITKHKLTSIEEAISVIKKFKGWTTYFKGFNDNRKNIYLSDDIPTSIIFRIIHDNLPKFMDNLQKWEKIQSYLLQGLDLSQIEEDFKKELSYKINHYTGEITSIPLNLENIFSLENFNNVLNQSGIDKFNTIIGGKFIEGEQEKRKGINEYINLYSQQNKEFSKTIRSLKMTTLFKQILSDKENHSFIMDKFENDKQVIDSINDYYKDTFIKPIEIGENKLSIREHIKQLVLDFSSNKLNFEHIYLKNDQSLTNVSSSLYGNWEIIKNGLVLLYKKSNPYKNNDAPNDKEKKEQDKWLKSNYFSVSDIQKAINLYFTHNHNNEIKTIENPITSYLKNVITLIDGINKQHSETKSVLDATYYETGDKNKELLGQSREKDTEKIKILLDCISNLLHAIKPFELNTEKEDDSSKNDNVNVLEKDTEFYLVFEACYEKIKSIITLYNKVRNYVTQKPYSIEKYKLNFENVTLADGWDKNKESANTCILFLKDEHYYLGVMDKKHTTIFSDEIIEKTKGVGYKKVVYKLLPGANKMLPKVFFSEKNINYYKPSTNILRIRNHSTHTKNGEPQKGFLKQDFCLNDCREIIDFFKESISKHPEWCNFGFNFSSTQSYNSIDGFYREIEEQGYKLTFQDLKESYINSLIDEGKLYLFQIYNKDFSLYSKGTPNLHTLYWKALFDKKNLENIVYKLNGQAELFYRKKSIEKNITHPKKVSIMNKNTLNAKKESIFDYDLIKNKRFTENKFFFHCPITINFGKSSQPSLFNNRINNFLKNNTKNIHILGIDRGERHLAYYTLLDPQGNIIKQGSFNTITNKTKDGIEFNQDYHQKLSKVEGDRDAARKNWKKIENIKDLKEGYLSQIVHKIAEMIIEYNAIVVFEDLNTGFKRGRFKVEKQVYQKLEKMLIDKLNYLVFKNKNIDESGGLLKGYQLTAPFESFYKMGKQTGIIYYVPAYHTSKIDPITGFVNLLYPKYESVDKTKEFINYFSSIQYNKAKDYFEFTFDYNNFPNKVELTKTKWTFCTYGNRLENFRNPAKNNQWDTREINLTASLKELLSKHNVSYVNENNLLSDIVRQESKELFKSFIHHLNLTLQMRNSKTGTDEDYLISPIADKNGVFFDSRNADDSLPKDADANGAYHIGLKGLMLLEKITKWNGEKNPDLIIRNKDWYEFVQNRNK